MNVVSAPSWGQRLRPALAGASAANVAFLLVWGTLFRYREADAFYLVITRRDVLAAVLNIVAAGLVVGLLAWAASRAGRAWLRVLLGVGLVAGTLAVLNVLRQYLRLTPNAAGEWIGALGKGPTVVLVLVLGAAGAALAWRWRVRLRAGLELACLTLSPFLAVTFARAAWISATGRLDERFAPRAAETAEMPGPRPPGRVVLVVFDELDYRLAFVDRPAGVTLPAFDALGREAVVATRAEPPAANTNEAVPSLIIGRRVASTEATDTRTARLVLADSSLLSTDSVTTLFRRARAVGARSGLIGWNLPYCRSGLSDGASRCAWWPSGILLGVRESLPRTMLHQWISVSPVNSRAVHQLRHVGMMTVARELLADTSLDLVLLHVVPPHYPWIYHRSGRYTLASFGARGYAGNLVLADAVLAEIRSAIEATGQGGRTTLIVTSDHSWRQSAVFDGRTDARVPFLVRLPGPARPDTVSAPVSTMVLGELALAALAGDLRVAAQVAERLVPNRQIP